MSARTACRACRFVHLCFMLTAYTISTVTLFCQFPHRSFCEKVLKVYLKSQTSSNRANEVFNLFIFRMICPPPLLGYLPSFGAQNDWSKFGGSQASPSALLLWEERLTWPGKVVNQATQLWASSLKCFGKQPCRNVRFYDDFFSEVGGGVYSP